MTGLEHSAHVLEKGGKVFSATLGLVDIVKGTNSYYKLQLLEDDKSSRCVLGVGACRCCMNGVGLFCWAVSLTKPTVFSGPRELGLLTKKMANNEAFSERGMSHRCQTALLLCPVGPSSQGAASHNTISQFSSCSRLQILDFPIPLHIHALKPLSKVWRELNLLFSVTSNSLKMFWVFLFCYFFF